MLPLYELVDLRLSPAEIFPAFLEEPYPVFLDSGMSPERLGRYSYVTADPLAVLKSKGDRYELQEGARRRMGKGDPFLELQRQLGQGRLPLLPGLPPFQGGWAGYFGYELGRHVERLPSTVVDDLGLPDLFVCLYDWVMAHDHVDGRTWLFADGGPEGDPRVARERLAWAKSKVSQWTGSHHVECSTTSQAAAGATLQGKSRNGSRMATASPGVSEAGDKSQRGLGVGARFPRPGDGHQPLNANFTHEAYVRAVEKVKDYILAGDTYQVNLSQRFDAPLPCPPWTLYTLLREINPAPFAAYLQYPELTVLSASPEQFLKLENGIVETRPIKGTRPRGANPELDRRLAQELLDSEKDRAENLMIVDLLRNDLGRVCRTGSVAVPELFVLEEYPTVFHLVSTVVGRLPEEIDAVALLRACFPGGSITGAPKIRAMEVIDELEPTERGVYCGSIGYLGHNGCMNTSIVIRTMVVRDGRVYFQAGGGIVADSDPEGEYQETLDKARALVLALAEAGSR